MSNSFDLTVYYQHQRYAIHIGTYLQSLQDIHNSISQSFNIDMNEFLIEIFDEIHNSYFTFDKYYLEDLRTDSSLVQNQIINARIRCKNQSAFNMINNDYETSTERHFEADHIVIWLDHHIGQPENCIGLKHYLSCLIDPDQRKMHDNDDDIIDSLIRIDSQIRFLSLIKSNRRLFMFSEIDQCMEFIYEMSEKRHTIFIIIDDMSILKLLPQIFDNIYIHKIYVFLYYSYPLKLVIQKILEHPDKVNVFNHETDLFIRLVRDIARYYVYKASLQYRNTSLCSLFLNWAKEFYKKSDIIDPLSYPPLIESKFIDEQVKILEEKMYENYRNSFSSECQM